MLDVSDDDTTSSNEEQDAPPAQGQAHKKARHTINVDEADDTDEDPEVVEDFDDEHSESTERSDQVLNHFNNVQLDTHCMSLRMVLRTSTMQAWQAHCR